MNPHRCIGLCASLGILFLAMIAGNNGYADVLATPERSTVTVTTRTHHGIMDSRTSGNTPTGFGFDEDAHAGPVLNGETLSVHRCDVDEICSGTSHGSVCQALQAIGGQQPADRQSTEVESQGLLLHYDFARGSAPDTRGRIKDLARHGSDGVLRPMIASPPDSKRSGWLEHRILQGDGRSGWVARPAEIQTLRHPAAKMTMPFGLVWMDNKELAILCSAEGNPTKPIIAFSRDGGDRWSKFHDIPGATGRPMVLTDHGRGKLSFVTSRRYFSFDYGRTWTDSVPHPPTRAGYPFHLEGTAWVDRDGAGRAQSILELGWHYEPGKQHPRDDATVVFRRSKDGGRSW
ncbi:MAG: hypothetical protein ABGZ17_17175, partial [Planctomycetaceae bacterium]